MANNQREPVLVIMPANARSAILAALTMNIDICIRRNDPGERDFVTALRAAFKSTVMSFPDELRGEILSAALTNYPQLQGEFE